MTSNIEDFYRFVHNMSENAARRMKDEKITSDLAHLMSDEELSQYLPVHGHRLRLRRHLNDSQNQSNKKNKLPQILHGKIEKARNRKKDYSSSEEDNENMRRQYGNRNALKGTRYIEIGWIHKTHQRTKQVRSKTGGGTRKLSMRKDSTKTEIMAEAKRLFFPNGKSSKGNLSDVECDVWDFSERKLCDDVTIQQMYEQTKLPTLRFYLATWDKHDSVGQGTDNGPIQDSSKLAEPSDNISNTVTTSTGSLSQDIVSAAIQISGILPDDTIDSEVLDTNDDFDIELEVPTVTIPTPEKYKNVVVKVHRGHALKEMINTFKTINIGMDKISFEMIMPNGKVETAEDGGGFTRDCLTEFWTEFYEQCTLGTNQKVPFLRHDFGEEEWKAVGKIICFGWTSHGYFPLQISLPFMEQSFFGNHKTDVVEAFYNVVPEHERTCLQTAVSDFMNVDQDELMDILDAHEVRQLPDQSNINRLVQEIAHKELIQVPMFVADCWYDLLKTTSITDDQLISLYTELKPTPRTVCKALTFPESMSVEETTVSNHLKRFIRDLDLEHLRRFLRFCTGSDLLITKNISVTFVNVTGLARRPVAHTCTCMLELSKNYDSYPQFRAEFMGVLESNIWVMEIL